MSFGWESGILVNIVEVGDSTGGYRVDGHQARVILCGLPRCGTHETIANLI
jgi:hypothetical protein